MCRQHSIGAAHSGERGEEGGMEEEEGEMLRWAVPAVVFTAAGPASLGASLSLGEVGAMLKTSTGGGGQCRT